MAMTPDDVSQDEFEPDFNERLVNEAWCKEISRRLDEIQVGSVKFSTFEQTRAKARALLDALNR
ncbi:MAG: hypothetical protein ACTHXA_14175 [Gulosibacter sp.]|uniref:hypothetical protein n=1 Tax=Gulosibacter sp. TaxID=2817531 RepID=UPI003F91CE49